MVTFAQRLKNLMSDLNLSQTKVSQMTGLSPSTVSLYLKGKREPYTEMKKELATALGMNENYFFNMTHNASY